MSENLHIRVVSEFLVIASTLDSAALQCHASANFFVLFWGVFAPIQDYFSDLSSIADYFSVEIHEMGSRLGGNSHLQFNCRKKLNLVHEVLIKTRRVLLEYCCYISVVLRRPQFSPR